MADTVAAASGYANSGWYVFPLLAGTKRPAVPSHPEHECSRQDPQCSAGHVGWEGRSTVNNDEIQAFWGTGSCGLAIATGPSKLLVVDLDVAKGPGQPSGFDSLLSLEVSVGERLPKNTFTVVTPSGGRHLYFRQPAGKPLSSTAGRLGQGIDTRGAGGYVVAPPTRLVASPPGDLEGEYRIACDRPPAELPAWLGELLSTAPHRRTANGQPAECRHLPNVSSDRQRRYVDAAVAGELRRVAEAHDGQRNNSLFQAAIAFGQLVAGGLLDESEARDILDDCANGHVAAGAYDVRQARKTIESGLGRGLREPRVIS